MLHVVTCEIDGIYGPCGHVFNSRQEALAFAKAIAETALDQLCDAVPLGEWYDLAGEEVDPYQALKSDDPDLVGDMIGQISDAMKADRSGYVDLADFDDIFELLVGHDVASWCSNSLKVRIAELHRAYSSLLDDLEKEWACE